MDVIKKLERRPLRTMDFHLRRKGQRQSISNDIGRRWCIQLDSQNVLFERSGCRCVLRLLLNGGIDDDRDFRRRTISKRGHLADMPGACDRGINDALVLVISRRFRESEFFWRLFPARRSADWLHVLPAQTFNGIDVREAWNQFAHN